MYCYTPRMADSEPETYLLDPEEFLAAHHPANDDYIQSVEHIQRRLITASKHFRRKQVNILKAVFSGLSYVDVGKRIGAHPATVGKLANSKEGQNFLALMQYHQSMLEGANLAQTPQHALAHCGCGRKARP